MHPLHHKLRQLRIRLRQLLLLHGLSATVAAVLLTMLVLGAADYAFRLRDPGVRVLSSLGLLVVAGWTAYRFLWKPLAGQWADAEIALQLKRRFPEFGEQLACALEFLDQAEDEPTAGSPVLRRAVIDRVWRRVEKLDLRAALSLRVPLRALTVAVTVCLLAAIVAVLDPISTRIAAARLANPLLPPPWPQKTHLALRNVVERVARGDAFEVEVVDRYGRRLPEKIQIEYRLPSPEGATSIESEPMRRRGKAIAFARREHVARPFAYRVVGGDDNSMPWVEVEVADPPAMEDLTLQLAPPAYTGYPPYVAEKHLRVLKGTTLSATGSTNRPLKSLVLHRDGHAPVAAGIDGDGLEFYLPDANAPAPRLETSGDYWFTLADREGLTAETPHWEFNVVADSPPSVMIEQPSASLFVTPEAVVPIRVAAKDNLAVRKITLTYQLAQQTDSHELHGELVLFEGSPTPQPPENGKSSPLDNPGDYRAAERRWSIQSLGLRPGAQLLLRAAAEDYQPVVAESPPVRLSIITIEELEGRIAAQQNLILAELRRALEIQQRSRSLVVELGIRIDQTRHVTRAEVDHMQAAELLQRQLERELTGPNESVASYIHALLTDLDNNRVDNPELQQRMQELLASLDRLQREELPPIRHVLISAVKSAQASSPTESPTESPTDSPTDHGRLADPHVVKSLTAARDGQQRVIDTLAALLKDLSRWDDYRRFYREMAQLAREQEDLAQRTSDAGRQTMGRNPRDLPPEELATLRTLGAAQLDLAQRLDRLTVDMELAVGQLEASNPLAADTVRLAVEEVRRLAMSDLMRTGSENVSQNRIGQATMNQHRIGEAFQQVLDVLANRREHELERLAERLQQAESDLADLARRQTQLKDDLREAARRKDAEELDPAELQRRLEALAREQSDLAAAADRTARRLGYLEAQAAAETTARAGDAMAEASKAARPDQTNAAADYAGQAEELLNRARNELLDFRRQTQARLAAEQLARLEDAVGDLHRSQQKLIGEMRQVDQSLDSPDGMTRAHLAAIQDLIRLQQAIRADTEHLGRKLLGANAIQLVLDAAAGHMAEVAARLQRRQTGQETQDVALRARDRLAMLLEAFQTGPVDPSHDPAGGNTGAGGDASAMGEPLPAAEVKLLLLLQQDINRRTAELAASVSSPSEMSQDQQEEARRLAEEQGRLANLAVAMLLDRSEQPSENTSPAIAPESLTP